jgi:hypothetical protein
MSEIYDWELAGDFDDDTPSKNYIYNLRQLALGCVASIGSVAVIAVGVPAIINQHENLGFQGRSTDANKIIEGKKLPGALPPSVANDYDAVLRLDFGMEYGSAVKVGKKLVFSAGHVVMTKGADHSYQLHCDSVIDSTRNALTQAGGYDAITNWYGKNTEPNPDRKADYTLFKIKMDPSFDELPDAPIASSPPSIGSDVFFINYQSNSTNLQRYPSKALAEYYDGKNYGHAAEYGGIVIAKYANEFLVAQSMQSYGPRNRYSATFSYPGASGGPVFNTMGQVEGVDDNIEDSTVSPSYILDNYGVHLAVKPQKQIKIAGVQYINSAILHSADKHIKQNLCSMS